MSPFAISLTASFVLLVLFLFSWSKERQAKKRYYYTLAKTFGGLNWSTSEDKAIAEHISALALELFEQKRWSPRTKEIVAEIQRLETQLNPPLPADEEAPV